MKPYFYENHKTAYRNCHSVQNILHSEIRDNQKANQAILAATAMESWLYQKLAAQNRQCGCAQGYTCPCADKDNVCTCDIDGGVF